MTSGGVSGLAFQRVRRGGSDLIPMVGLAFLTFATYAVTLGYPLLSGWDDHVYVTDVAPLLTPSVSNIFYWFATPHHGCYLPITMLSYMLDHALWGFGGGGCHAQNVFWHVICVLGVFKCARALRVGAGAAFAVSLIFAVHPQRVESVAWISERKDVICAAFYFWSAYLYLLSLNVRSGRRHVFMAGSLALFVLALLSKPMAVTLPVVLFLLESASRRPSPLRGRFARLSAHALLALAICPVTYYAHSRMGTIDSVRMDTSRQFFVVVRNIAWYAVNTFAPYKLSPIYPRISFTSLEIAHVALFYFGVCAAFWVGYWRMGGTMFRRAVLPLSACFAVSLVPVVGIVPFGFIDYADRYSYIPSAFLWIMAGIVATRCLKTRLSIGGVLARMAALFAVLYAVGLAAITLFHIQAWRSVYSIHRLACLRSPANDMALRFLADLEMARGNWGAVVGIADRLEALDGEWMTGRDKALCRQKSAYFRAVALLSSGDGNAALPIFEKLRDEYRSVSKLDYRRRADYKTTLSMLANIYARRGEREKALECAREFQSLSREGMRAESSSGEAGGGREIIIHPPRSQ